MTESFQPDDPVDADVLNELMSSGAIVIGQRSFEYAGEWGGDHHGVPIFVLTRTAPDPVVRGFMHYVTDIHEAVTQAKAAAGDKDVMVHGAAAVQVLHAAGLVDGYVISLVPVVLGAGKRLFAEPESNRLRLISARLGSGVVHLRYEVQHDA